MPGPPPHCLWRWDDVTSGNAYSCTDQRVGVTHTFGVVQDSLDENWILGDSLRHQQDALLDTMATQQRPTTGALSVCGGRGRCKQIFSATTILLIQCYSTSYNTTTRLLKYYHNTTTYNTTTTIKSLTEVLSLIHFVETTAHNWLHQ